jgi:hypothetical protein
MWGEITFLVRAFFFVYLGFTVPFGSIILAPYDMSLSIVLLGAMGCGQHGDASQPVQGRRAHNDSASFSRAGHSGARHTSLAIRAT